MAKPTIETRIYPTAVILSLSSGRLLCSFSDMHECAEFLAGTPIFTHQFAFRPFVDELKAAIFRQHPALQQFDAEAVTHDNWQQIVAAATKTYGETLSLHPMGEPEHFEDAFTEPLNGKAIVFVPAGAAREGSR